MPDIIISGEIGWEVTASGIREQFAALDPEAEAKIDLGSPGGSVFTGVEIGHMVSQHKGKTILTIQSAALSMGAHIAQNADVVKVFDDSTFMMHNPWMVTVGDHIEMAKDAKLLKSLAVMLSAAFAKKSGKDKKAVQKLMNSETWLFGQEIVDAGFADELITTENPESKDDAVAFAKLQFSECLAKLKKFEGADDDHKKIAALLPDANKLSPDTSSLPQPGAKTPVNPDTKPKENMTFEEFCAKYPDETARIVAWLDAEKGPELTAMTLIDVLALAPEAKTEHDQAVVDAKKEVETGKISALTVKSVCAVISSDAYGASIKAAGAKVLTGEKDHSNFEDLVALADESNEKFKSLSIKEKQPGKTPGEQDLGEAATKEAQTKASATALSEAINNSENKVQ